MSKTSVELIETEGKKNPLADWKADWKLSCKISVECPDLTKAQYADKLVKLGEESDSGSIELMLRELAGLVGAC